MEEVILTLSTQSHSRLIHLLLVSQKSQERWEEDASSGEELVKALDNLLKCAKMESNLLTRIDVVCAKESSLTSFRLAKTFQQALVIANSLKPRKDF